MKALLTALLVLALSGCTTFSYQGANGEEVSGTTWFKSFRDIEAKRGDFELSIGESTSEAPDPFGDYVCLEKLKAGLPCD